MGKKRRHEDKEERILRKIKKWRQKLEDNNPHILEDEFNDSANALEATYPAQNTESFIQHSPRDQSSRAWPTSPRSDGDTLFYAADTPCGLTPGPSQPPTAEPLPAPTATLVLDPVPGTSRPPDVTPQAPLPFNGAAPTLIDEVTDINLEDDILAILGDAPKPDTEYGPNVHKDVAARWQDILGKGLSKEVKEKLVKDYLIPANCPFLTPPILNPEAKAALSEPLVKRDYSLLAKQKQLAVALSALAQATEMIISKETNLQKVLKPISDASRLLCDSHHVETKTRRSFVISSINNTLKDTLIETPRDKYLFGDNVTEKLKAAKTIARSGEALKTQRRFNKTNFITNKDKNTNRLNSRAPHLRTSGRHDVGLLRTAPRQPPSRPPPPPPASRHRAGRSPPRQMQPPRRPYPPRR